MANAQNKVTRVEVMNICKGLVDGSDRMDKADILAVLDKCIESFSRKSVTKADKVKADENIVICDTVKEILANGKKMKIGDIAKSVNAKLGTDYSSQRVQYQVLNSVEGIKNSKEKGVSYYYM